MKTINKTEETVFDTVKSMNLEQFVDWVIDGGISPLTICSKNKQGLINQLSAPKGGVFSDEDS